MLLFKKLFSALNNESVKYMVAGGIAVNLYGIERATADIDLIIDLDEKNVSKFVRVAKKLGLRPKIPVQLDDFADTEKRKEWIDQKGMTVFTVYDVENPFFLVDIFVASPFDFDTVFEKREKMEFEDTVISVVPIMKLIAMKERSARPQDKADIFYLKKIMEEWSDDR
jgi:hypothetical protein